LFWKEIHLTACISTHMLRARPHQSLMTPSKYVTRQIYLTLLLNVNLQFSCDPLVYMCSKQDHYQSIMQNWKLEIYNGVYGSASFKYNVNIEIATKDVYMNVCVKKSSINFCVMCSYIGWYGWFCYEMVFLECFNALIVNSSMLNILSLPCVASFIQTL
jgi:hypothetical protein